MPSPPPPPPFPSTPIKICLCNQSSRITTCVKRNQQLLVKGLLLQFFENYHSNCCLNRKRTQIFYRTEIIAPVFYPNALSSCPCFLSYKMTIIWSNHFLGMQTFNYHIFLNKFCFFEKPKYFKQ